MRSGKRKIFQRAGVFFVGLSLIDVLGIELGFLPKAEAEFALNILIVLLAISVAVGFYLKNREE
mgnify:FL=1